MAFCAVQKGAPLPVDYDEPRRVAEACDTLGLKYAVVTSVNRDDRKDGGAELFALTIRAIRERIPGCGSRFSSPIFKASHSAMDIVMDAAPRRAQPQHRNRARASTARCVSARATSVLSTCSPSPSASARAIPTKSGLMLGLGETNDEVRPVMLDLRAHHVDILTLGQYLRPSPKHLPIIRYVPREEFDSLKPPATKWAFRTSKPVRSSAAPIMPTTR